MNQSTRRTTRSIILLLSPSIFHAWTREALVQACLIQLTGQQEA
uniref:Uncharacterized protein n=1 Tax=Arundo donax TaxID=35708 RepID=A0A0A9H0K7_ARUDO